MAVDRSAACHCGNPINGGLRLCRFNSSADSEFHQRPEQVLGFPVFGHGSLARAKQREHKEEHGESGAVHA